MSPEQIDTLWQQALRENEAHGEPTAHRFAALVRREVLLNVIQRLNQNPYSLTKSECISEVQAMRGDDYGHVLYERLGNIGAQVANRRQEAAATAAQPHQTSLGPLDPNESDVLRLWAEIESLRAAVAGPAGYASWQEAATAERVRRVKAEKALAAATAAQPQLPRDGFGLAVIAGQTPAQGEHKFVPAAAVAAQPAIPAEVLAALAELEDANDELCGLRTPELYCQMIDAGQQDALTRLDNARRTARDLLKQHAPQLLRDKSHRVLALLQGTAAGATGEQQ